MAVPALPYTREIWTKNDNDTGKMQQIERFNKYQSICEIK
jgi:hypothetical protein